METEVPSFLLCLVNPWAKEGSQCFQQEQFGSPLQVAVVGCRWEKALALSHIQSPTLQAGAADFLPEQGLVGSWALDPTEPITERHGLTHGSAGRATCPARSLAGAFPGTL
jgi:hypothetical protein